MRRINELEAKIKSVAPEERALLRWQLNKLEGEYDDTRSDLYVVPDEMERVWKALHEAKFKQEGMQERLGQCPFDVLNFRPEAMLHRVEFISEAEREELIKDALHPQTHYEAKCFPRAKGGRHSGGGGRAAEFHRRASATDRIGFDGGR